MGSRSALVLSLALVSGACSSGGSGAGHSAAGVDSDPSDSGAVGCTLIGCGDAATINLQSPTGAWTPGNYQIALVVDGGPATCTLPIPSSPSPTSDIVGTCTSGLAAIFQGESHCQTLPSDGAVSGEICTPVPGHFFMTVTLDGTPPQVDLTVMRNGNALVDQTIEFMYQDFQPNGPQCGSSCRGASASVTVGSSIVDAGSSEDSGTEDGLMGDE
jgi:hypothetical protein